ncbi:MAG TPA: decaprenyl-phosphate phosphoribosyltransferase [Gemmatimonadaceae bacterium]|nr:decaprenyl-phosphate phosphoribosyltransferase [Gemmatimonadaceae bacterium]
MAPEEVVSAIPRTQPMALIRLLRPKQWIKNLFVLAPLIFSGLFMRQLSMLLALFGTFMFCVASSIVYVFNDLSDRHIDALHPVKRLTRPLASGAVSVSAARVLLALLGAVLLLGSLVSPMLVGVLLVYVLLNVLYSVWLKRMPVVDIFCVAAGFVLRVYAGAVVIDVPLSSWMLITTLSIALYLAAIKRRDELEVQGDGARAVLGQYTIPLLERFALMASVCAMVFYSMFVVTTRPVLAFTIPFVLFGIFRYWFLVDRHGRGESPTDALWSDRPLAITVVLWGILCAYLLRQP